MYIDINDDVINSSLNFDGIEEFCIENGYKYVYEELPIITNYVDIWTLPKVTFIKDINSINTTKLFKKYTESKKENRELKLKIKELKEIESKYNDLKKRVQDIKDALN